MVNPNPEWSTVSFLNNDFPDASVDFINSFNAIIIFPSTIDVVEHIET